MPARPSPTTREPLYSANCSGLGEQGDYLADGQTPRLHPQKRLRVLRPWSRDVSPGRSDSKKRGLRAFPLIRRPIGRASRHHRSESRVDLTGAHTPQVPSQSCPSPLDRCAARPAPPERAFFAFRVGPEPSRTSARPRRAYGRLQRYRAVRIRYTILLSSPSVVVPPPSPRARQRAWSPVL